MNHMDQEFSLDLFMLLTKHCSRNKIQRIRVFSNSQDNASMIEIDTNLHDSILFDRFNKKHSCLNSETYIRVRFE